MTTLTTLIRRIESRYDRREIIEAAAADKIGELAFRALDRHREDEDLHDLPGWPKCQCSACGCDEPATTTDEGEEVCGACADYVVDEDGDVHCSRLNDVEIVSESCGAGNQMRSYARLIPPDMPAVDPAGEYACYWDSAGDDAYVVSRHSTRAAAAQAVAAHDWPSPGDHTQYLCGFTVRCLMDGRWQKCEDE